MPLSPVLYNSAIPFVHMEEARLIENVDNEMVVRVQLSNETTEEQLLAGPREFGNFVYLATDRDEIMNLAADPSRLKTMILSSTSDPSVLDNSYLSLTQKDFSPEPNITLQMPDVTPAPTVWAHRTVKAFVLNRIKGGSIMTGLIADAHIEKVFDGTSRVVGHYGAIGALSRGEAVIPLGGNRYRIPDDLDVSAGRQTVEDKKINNLYILVASYRLYKGACFLGNVTKEILLENGASKNKAVLWKLQDDVGSYGPPGTVWPGDIHIHNTKAMTGTFHRDIPHPNLELNEMDNIKVKDLRFLKVARTLPFVYASPEKELLPYFSPLSLSRDSHGQIHGVFSFDLYEYGRQNAKYGLLIKNTESLLSCLGIADVKISHRIIRQNQGGNKLTPGANLNADRPPGAALNQSGWVPIKKTDSNNNVTMGLLDLGGVDENRTSNVIFMDVGPRQLSKGTAEYKVEMIVEDKTKDVLTNLRDELQLMIKTYWTPYSSTNPEQAQFGPIIDTYLSTIGFIFGSEPFQEYSITMWRKNLEAMVAPSNPSDQDRVFVVDLIRDFISKISAQLHTSQSISDGTFHVYSSIAHAGTPEDLMETHVFRERYQMYRGSYLGMSYNDGYLTAATSLVPSISYADYSIRTTAELSKYELTNPSAEGINQYGYISPTSLMMGAINTQINQEATTAFDLNADRFTPLFRNNALGAYEYDYQPEKTTETNIEEIFNASGVQMTPLKRPLREVLFPDVDPVSTPLDAAMYMSIRGTFSAADTTGDISLSGSDDLGLMRFQSVSMTPRGQMLAAPAAQWVLNSQISRDSLPTTLAGFSIFDDGLRSPIPNSIAAAKVNQNPGIIEQSNSLSNAVNFEALVRVEYLEGYSTLGVFDPQWRILSTEVFAQAQIDQQPLLCRLVPLANVLDSPIELGLPALDTLFILGDPTPAPPRPQPTAVMEALKASLNSLAPTNILTAGDPYVHYSKNAIAITTLGGNN